MIAIGLARAMAMCGILCTAASATSASPAPPIGSSDVTGLLSSGEHHVSVRGVSIAYHVAGHGPLLVVMSPGWGIGSSYLQAGLRPMETTRRIVYVDERGNGLSARPASPKRMSYHDMALDLEALRVRWRQERLDVLGHSAGATVAMDYASAHPKRVGTLVLVDPELPGIDVSKPRRRFKERWRHDPAHGDAVRHHDDPMPATDEGFATYLRQTLAWYFFDPDRYAGSFRASIPGRLPVWTLRSSISSDRAMSPGSRPVLARVTATTLVVVGRDDAECPVEMAQAIQSRIAGSRMVIIPHAGHFPWMESGSRFFGQVDAFLKATAGPDRLAISARPPAGSLNARSS